MIVGISGLDEEAVEGRDVDVEDIGLASEDESDDCSTLLKIEEKF